MTGELLALGASHKTAPLALREKLALPEGRAAPVLARADRPRGGPRGRGALHLQPHRALPGDRRMPVEAENAALAILSRQAGIRPTELLGSLYSLRGARGRARTCSPSPAASTR